MRVASFACLRSLDNALLQGRGEGLAAFRNDAPGSEDKLCRRPLLCWHFDQASTNMATAMCLVCEKELRLLLAWLAASASIEDNSNTP